MHSQEKEEIHILKAFEGRESGRLLDVGAWHFEQLSNSRALIESGWSGVLVEPSPKCMDGLLAVYGENSKVTLLQAAVSTSAGLLDMHISDDAVSTSSEAEYEKWKGTAKFRGRVLVPAITLEDIGNRFSGFDFLNLDAEGHSADLFIEAMRLNWRPRCICVEHDGRTTELMCRGADCNYTCVYANSTNLVLVR